MSKLRKYQRDLVQGIWHAWAGGSQVVMGVLPTGGGKTVCMGDIIRNYPVMGTQLPDFHGNGSAIAMAHRSELVAQISQALAREEIRHCVLAPTSLIRQIQSAHLEEMGKSFVDPMARMAVASVDSMHSRPVKNWIERQGGPDKISLVVQDEGHHVLRKNKWGKAMAMFPSAFGLLFTATPIRADGNGLGAHADGMVDQMVIGPAQRALIDMGMLTDYRYIGAQAADLNLNDVHLTASGELNEREVAAAMARSRQIVGDVVKHYLQHASGKLGITFAANIEEAQKITNAFNAAGVAAALVTAESSTDERRRVLRDFKNRKLLQLVNVDLFGEGFDLPAVEVVSMARPTASFALFAQQWGRALRLMISPELMAAWDTFSDAQRLALIAQSGKPFALIIDHVGNMLRHGGPPDKPRPWSLNGAERRNRSVDDAIPLTSCDYCHKPYERIYPACPHCGAEREVGLQARSDPKKVDGDLMLYSPELMAQLRGDVAKVNRAPTVPQHLQGTPAGRAIVNRHTARLRAQQNLRHVIAWWAGCYPDEPERVLHRRFFHTFGIDIMTAATLGEREATELRARIEAHPALACTVIYGLPFPDEHPTAEVAP